MTTDDTRYDPALQADEPAAEDAASGAIADACDPTLRSHWDKVLAAVLERP